MKILEPNTSPIYPILQGESVQEYRQKKRMELFVAVYSDKGENWAEYALERFDKAFPVDVIEGAKPKSMIDEYFEEQRNKEK